jgi:hypothetical protein
VAAEHTFCTKTFARFLRPYVSSVVLIGSITSANGIISACKQYNPGISARYSIAATAQGKELRI